MSAVSTRPDGPPATDTPSARAWLLPLLRRLHFFAGLLVGPFILIAALSGGMYALAPLLEKGLYAHELTASSTETAAPLVTQITAAQAYVGGGDPVAVRPAPAPGDTTRVLFADPALPESTTRAVFVDPATAEIRGDLPVYGTSGALPLRHWISDLHRSLHLGDVGRWYSELAASWLGIVALAGLALWVGRRTGRRRRPSRRVDGYRRLSNRHAVIGVWVVLGAVFLSATGITWSAYAGANIAQLRAAMGAGTPVLNTTGAGAITGHAHHGGASAAPVTVGAATFEDVLAVARSTDVDSAEVEIRPPAGDGAAWVVQEIHRSFPTEVDAVAIDASTMRVSDRVRFADYPLLAKLSRWGIDLHSGTLFGLANQLVLFALAIGIAALVVLGYAMWWTRRPTRGLAAAPARGVLRHAPWWGTSAVLVAAVAIGIVLPLVGYTLAAFVVFDSLVGWRARRAARC
ncbi:MULTISPECIES: PepSY domain-containing protein [Microbacterium]|uniref:PepSY-associated TM helix domain-containing protein n=1 Tax=Microbacterium TaxID=33882 RepID=UPI0027856653|nr:MULTISPECIES: PepSY-associated TM helix domain-containing protein [Microbacterium]MDQ1084840.1 putative iron-regulated membrane protein [Microbacterium sp. SORGH_AS_0344]MDQ1169880.1 putative iron-regulated membrane protein [Microbacterium proteolyticum]